MTDFSRQSFLGPGAQEKLKNTRVAIVGLGGGGSHIAQQLAHVGVGEIRLIDPDRIEDSNLNRLIGATDHDIKASTRKVDIAKRLINGIRPWITTPMEEKKWQEVDWLLRDSHIIFGCVDGFQQRDYLDVAARRYRVPYIDIGMDVTEVDAQTYAVAGQMIMTRPDGPCLRCLGFIDDEIVSKEENRYGDAGGNPQVVWANGTLASLAVGAFVKLFTPWHKTKEAFSWLELDGNAQTVVQSKRPRYMPQHAICPHHSGPDDLGDPFFSLGNLVSH